MSDVQCEKIARAWMNGVTLPEIAEQYAISEREAMQAIVREVNRQLVHSVISENLRQT